MIIKIKKVFLTTIIFLLALPIVLSIASEIILHEGFETAGNQNFTLGSNTGVSSAGMLTIFASSSGATSTLQMINLSTNTNNFSCEWQMNSSGISNSQAWLELTARNNSGDFDGTNRQWYGNIQSGNLFINDFDQGVGDSIDLGAQSSTFKNYTIIFFEDTSIEAFVDGISQGTALSANSDSGNWTYFKIFAQTGGIGMDNFTCYNGTSKPEDIILDTTIPSFGASSINNSAPRVNDVVLFSQVVQDETALSSYRFAHNQSGSFVNSSSFGISGTSQNATFNLSINQVARDVIGFIWHTEDTSGNANTTAIGILAVANTPPETPTITFPTVGLVTFLQPMDMNVTFPEDADLNTISISYYIDDVLNQTSDFNVTFNASDATYNLKVSLFDGIDFSSNASVTFTIDTINPIITITVPINNTVHNTDITVDLTCDNTNVLNFTYNFHNDTDVVQVSVNETSGLTQTKLTQFVDTTGIGIGDYNMNITCTDNASNSDMKFLVLNFDNIAPTLSVNINNTVANESEIIQINGTCSDSNLDSIEVQINSSGSFVTEEIVNNIVGTSIVFIHNETVELGFIAHRYICEDILNQSTTSGLFNYTGLGTPDLIPNATLITPLNNTIQSSTTNSTNFDCSAQDDQALVNISLFHNLSGTFGLITTNGVSGTSASASFTEEITFNKTIRWNCRTADNSSQTAFAPDDFTFTINQTFIEEVAEAQALPLQNAVSIVAMVALLLIIITTIGFGITKRSAR